MIVLKKIMLPIVICLSLSVSLLDAGGIKKRIIIDPQYSAAANQLSCKKEKDSNNLINNVVNRLVAEFKNNKNYNVVLTNLMETHVEDNERSRVANTSSGDILISIAVSCPKDDQKNVEITNSMIEFEKASENSISGKNVFSQEDILNDLMKDSKKKYNEGVVLSKLIQKKMAQKKINVNKEIKYEPIGVLIGANMPGTLIRLPCLETLSVDYDNQHLEKNVIIDRLVASIYAGVSEFSEKGK
jgi:N-acetylmuramoyl-L-alanine amidase